MTIKWRILIVEDDHALSLGLRINLEAEGYEVIHALTAEEGLTILDNSSVDLVVLDLMLPGLDGLEVYHHRNDERARQQFLAQARQFGLLVSGGSDEHGWWKSRLATQPVTAEMLDALRMRAGKYRQ